MIFSFLGQKNKKEGVFLSYWFKLKLAFESSKNDYLFSFTSFSFSPFNSSMPPQSLFDLEPPDMYYLKTYLLSIPGILKSELHKNALIVYPFGGFGPDYFRNEVSLELKGTI